ncbi:transglycosylase SLT domain-containing protein [Pseudomonas sp. App30]|uniref:transglycosylase SLT domain-containing protein n=1 Tax=Pseudomonas sp. App30 TaxID=3068990 RepID=UPI003A80BC86
MPRPSLLTVLLLALLAPLPAMARLAGPPEVVHPVKVRDLADIRQSRVLRVLVNQSRNSSGEVQGECVGMELHRLRAFEQYLNGHANTGQAIHLKIIPRPKEQLISALQRGEGDLVAPGELVDMPDTQLVSASAPVVNDVPLVLVGAKGARRYGRVEQLAGKTVSLPAGSAAGDALLAVNQKLALHKLAPIKVEWADPSLAVEDVLEMVQAGILPMTIVERPIAQRWAKVMPKLMLEPGVHLGAPRQITWYVRNDASMLHASVDRFLQGYRAPTDQDATLTRAYKGLYRVHNPLAASDRQRLEKLRPVLQRYAREQNMDWLNLAALAYKESQLDPSVRGGGGATGLLQITPSAARRVGVGNVQNVDNNVQAAARYLAMIRKKFFASSQLNERERMAFVLAAYNMGPERVQAMRAEARRRGLNPNQWFFQVERVAMEQAGMPAVSYVNSVNKYYLAYDRERDTLDPGAMKGRRIAFNR